ncbi:putative yir4 protein [Plasmodium yoelii yoelii]|uniref:Yir4 protein n=1 Tax=Plasmodium yoelii yoelii TaxID=73239 RepID=Q7R8Z0_PLAYO|nr:putative yir4 protein [Plasmodium yoelii yoelii]
MDDTLCGKFDSLREYLPDDLKDSKLDFYDNNNFKNYCPDKNCNSELEKITIGFLWLLEQYFGTYRSTGYGDNTNPFFLYMISWLSYKLKQNSVDGSTTINGFYNEHVKNSGKYPKFTNAANTFTNLEDVLNTKSDLLNNNIEDLSEFYDIFKLICSMYNNVETNSRDKLPNNANAFIEKYRELSNNCNIKGTAYSKIFSALSTDYDNFKNYCNKKGANCKEFSSLPEITTKFAAQLSGDTSSSSIGNKLFTVLSIFVFVIWISETSSKTIFKRKNKKYKEENESLIYDLKSSDYLRSSNND